MSGAHVQRWTGVAGIAGTVLGLGGYSVFIFRAGFPPTTDTEAALAAFLRSQNASIQTGVLLFFVAFAVWFVFFAGLRALIAEASPRLEFLATAIFGLGAAILVLSFVFLGMEAAATANALTRPDNSVIYAMFMGGSVLNGAPTGVPVAAFLALSGWALWRSRLLSSWAAWLSWVMAIVVVATLPALYQGDYLAGIYSADGLVADVLAFVPLFVWTTAVSIAILRKPAAR